MAVDRLRADRQHLGADVGEALDLLGVGRELLGAHRRVVARVEDEHHGPAPLVGQREVPPRPSAVDAGQGEVRRARPLA